MTDIPIPNRNFASMQEIEDMAIANPASLTALDGEMVRIGDLYALLTVKPELIEQGDPGAAFTLSYLAPRDWPSDQ